MPPDSNPLDSFCNFPRSGYYYFDTVRESSRRSHRSLRNIDHYHTSTDLLKVVAVEREGASGGEGSYASRGMERGEKDL